jgi:hypothetical protein
VLAGADRVVAASDEEWFRVARLARTLSWVTLGLLGIEAGVAVGAAIVARSVALLGFGLDSGIEAFASLIVMWRFTGTRLMSPDSERRAQQLVAVSFLVLAPYIAYEAARALAAGERAETSLFGIALTAGTAVFEPALGLAYRRLGRRLGSLATAGEGTQNLLCAYLAAAVLAGLVANTVFGLWWLDGDRRCRDCSVGARRCTTLLGREGVRMRGQLHARPASSLTPAPFHGAECLPARAVWLLGSGRYSGPTELS